MSPATLAALAGEATFELRATPAPFGGRRRFAAEYVYWRAVRMLRLPQPASKAVAQAEIASVAETEAAPGAIPEAAVVEAE